MNKDHTKGPWNIVMSDNATPHIMHSNASDVDDHDKLVCIMPAEISRSYNSSENAKLISSAPMMLEALKSVNIHLSKLVVGGHLDKKSPILGISLDAVISKAENW